MTTLDSVVSNPTPTPTPASAPAAGVQRARWALNLGDRVNVAAEVSVTSVGLLSIGAMVGSILLASAAIVRVARRPR